MSVQSEITRLTGAKTGLAEWLTDNGVTVPSGAKLDALVALLADVEAGGGGGGFETGTFTPASSGQDYTTITHNLGRIPNYIAIFVTDISYAAGTTSTYGSNPLYFILGTSQNIGAYNQFYMGKSGGSLYWYSFNRSITLSSATSGVNIYNVTNTTLKFAHQGYAIVGHQYRWVVV